MRSGPALEALGIRAERSDLLPAGGSLLAHLRERIEHCQYLIAKMDVDCHNAFFGIGHDGRR
jgi:hypothetical protein